ncbi:hypothetical protein [Actinomadura coerulea]|uniref:hypothetical protein n=1 Tax=Actinomadura coerulea TaxID=46159 RepID=UPI003446CAF9
MRIVLTVLAVTAVLAGGLAGCGDSKHDERLKKAAGITAFRIRCTQDLWNRTGGHKASWGDNYRDPVKARVIERHGETITLEMTGPHLVDLLNKLHHMDGPGASDPLARRMYEAIAPQIDAVQATPAQGAPVPEVVIDDTVGTAPASPTASSPAGASASPSTSNK